VIQVQGEGAESIPTDFQNPVLRAATRLFQHQQMAPAGLNITIQNHIPLNAGLDADAALLMGGLVAANNMIDGVLGREALVGLALEIGVPHVDALTTMLGGLNICITDNDGYLMHKSLEPPPLQMVVAVPDVPDYAKLAKKALPEHVALDDAVFNMGRLVFLLDALVAGDFKLLARAMQDKLYQSAYTQHIPGYDEAVAAAHAEGAAAVTLANQGPTLLAFAPYNHQAIAEAIAGAFAGAGVEECRTWTLGIDGQGVTVSVLS
jgi:homoserine kinase